MISAALPIALIGFFLWVIGDRVVGTLVLLSIVSTWLVIALSLFALIVLSAIVLRAIPEPTRTTCRERPFRFRSTVLFAVIFFVYVGWTINHHWLPGRYHPISLIFDVVILAAALAIGWSLLRPSRARAVTVVSTAVILMVLVSLSTAISPRASGESGKSLDALRSLLYVTWVPVDEVTADESGVAVYDSSLASPGLNLYASRNLPSAFLVDMDGSALHAWSAEIESGTAWGHVEPYQDGDLLAIHKDHMLLRLDWDSNIRWVKPMRAHHDIAVADDGDIYILDRRDAFVTFRGLPMPILDDHVVVISPANDVKKELSLFGVMKDEIPTDRLLKIYTWLLRPTSYKRMIESRNQDSFMFIDGMPVDVFHSNSIQLLDRDIDGFCRRGNLLYCSRNLDMIAVIDIDAEKVVWSWGQDVLEGPHHPTLLDNGNVLIFDNGHRRKYSRIIELNPLTLELEWEYSSEPKEEFFSYWRGACERLPNGNTLVTNSDGGQVFEVTADGQIVWEFYNPNLKEDTKQRAAIYRMTRITDPGDRFGSVPGER